MKPVQPILRLRVQILLHLPHIVSPVGKKRNLLIHRHALRLQQFENPSSWLGIIGLYETETLLGLLCFRVVAFELQHALAGDHFKTATLVPGAYETSVQPHRQRTIRNRQLLPILLAALDQGQALFAQFLLHPFGHFEQVITEGDRAELLVHWQHPCSRSQLTS